MVKNITNINDLKSLNTKNPTKMVLCEPRSLFGTYTNMWQIKLINGILTPTDYWIFNNNLDITKQ